MCFSTADWDAPLPTNKHQVMRRLARRNRVLFIETLGTRAPRATAADAARIGRRLRRGFEGPRRAERNLWTLSPLVRPSWRTAADRSSNRLAFRLTAAASLERFPDPVAWVYSPYAVHLLDVVRPKLVVYHMVDDLAAVPGADADALRDAENRLLARADCVFCTERSLFDRARLINPAALFMPNVADFRHFSGPKADVADPRFARLRALPGPRLLFSGNLAPHKVDFAVLDAIAQSRPDWSLVLVGPEWEGAATPASLARLRRRPNAHFLGAVPYGDLPAYLHEADLLLVPYVRSRATTAVFPLKFFEYLATGLPVVASPLPSLLPYREAVRLAGSPASWPDACAKAMADPESMAEQRRTLARRHTWTARLLEMERDLKRALWDRQVGAGEGL